MCHLGRLRRASIVWPPLARTAREAAEHDGTTLEWVADGCLNGFNDGEVELMTKMSVEGKRPLNWNVLTIDSARPDAYLNQINACAILPPIQAASAIPPTRRMFNNTGAAAAAAKRPVAFNTPDNSAASEIKMM